MPSIEFIKSIDWNDSRRAPMMYASSAEVFPPACQGVKSYVRYWSTFSRIHAYRRGVQRRQERISDLQPRELSRQVEGRVLLAEGLHLRVPDRDRRFRQTR